MAYYNQSPVAVAQPFHHHQQPHNIYNAGPSLSSQSSQSHHSKARGHRLCDTCGKVETAQTGRFRLCGGCMVTQYCSPECQKKNWQQHKELCRHTSGQLSASKQHAVSAGPSAEFPDEDLPKHLRKFTSAHADLIGWTVFQALQLKRVPAKIRQHVLQINLSFRNSSESSRRFAVTSVGLESRSVLQKIDPVVADDILRREERCRRAGGIGVAVVILKCGVFSQVMPVEVDPPHKIAWESRDDWEQTFRLYVDAGRTDFRPPVSRR